MFDIELEPLTQSPAIKLFERFDMYFEVLENNKFYSLMPIYQGFKI